MLTAALFRDMVTYMKADELITGYTTAYPDDGAEGDFLVEEGMGECLCGFVDGKGNRPSWNSKYWCLLYN